VNTVRQGRRWERFAETWLHRQGLKTMARNFHCRLGEIDLVMADGERIVFVEVRFRGHGSRGSGPQSVTFDKQLRVSRAAGIFLNRHPRLADRPCRFDVIALDGDLATPRLRWIRNAFHSALD